MMFLHRPRKNPPRGLCTCCSRSPREEPRASCLAPVPAGSLFRGLLLRVASPRHLDTDRNPASCTGWPHSLQGAATSGTNALLLFPVYRPPSSSGEEGEGARGSSEGTKRSPQRGAEGLNSGRTGFEYRFCHLPPCQPRPPLTPTWFLRSSPPNPARGGTNVHPASLLGGARGACRCPSWCLACHSLLTKWKLP